VVVALLGRPGRINRVRGAAVGLALATATVLGGCAAGQHAQTIGQVPAIDGVAADSGTIAIRAAAIVAPTGGGSYAAGGVAPLTAVLVNTGTSADKLTAVSSPAATAAVLVNGSPTLTPLAGGAAASTTPAASATPASATPASATPAGSATPAASATAAGSATPGASAGSSSAAAPASTPIDLPPGQSVQVGFGSGPSIVLTGLVNDLFPSQVVPVTFTFASGASLSTNLAVQIQKDGASGAPTIDIAPSEG
jgi:copper(I)-binding protein